MPGEPNDIKSGVFSQAGPTYQTAQTSRILKPRTLGLSRFTQPEEQRRLIQVARKHVVCSDDAEGGGSHAPTARCLWASSQRRFGFTPYNRKTRRTLHNQLRVHRAGFGKQVALREAGLSDRELLHRQHRQRA